MRSVALYIDVPCATFRDSRNREYGQSYLVPPPSTVYGMLLSLVGETDSRKHCGVKLAIAMISQPQKSQMLRKMRRFKVIDYSDSKNSIPEHQEIITDIKSVVWINSEMEEVKPNLAERIYQAKMNPSLVRRFGCLYLGESSDLVNSVKLATEKHISDCKWWLVRDHEGRMTLPYWVNHIGSRGTGWLRYSLIEISLDCPHDSSWTVIQPNFYKHL